MTNLYDRTDSTEDRFRNAVLDALNMAARDSGLKDGWKDEDLPELFKAVDAQRARIEKRGPKDTTNRDVLRKAVRLFSRPENCECDNTHKQNDTCCVPCWNAGFRRVVS
jgi:hypothetical protein